MSAYRTYSSLPLLSEHKAEARIRLSALVKNYIHLSSGLCGKRAICVVKADAYGHGAPECIRALLHAGCDFFAVSSIEEAIAARCTISECGGTGDIIILGYTLPSQAELLARYDIIQTISSFEYACSLSEQARACGVCVRAHVAIDTGMNRIGLCADSRERAERTIDEICRMHTLGGLSVEGMFTHFSDADEALPRRRDITELEFGRFISVRDGLISRGVDAGFCHACNSAAAVEFPHLHLDGVRFGIMLYGVLPSENISFELEPVMELSSVVAHVHTLSAGESVSYGGEYTASESRLIATLPIGYADGFMRSFSGGYVYLETKSGTHPSRVVGRVCMDQCMLDATDTDVREGDRAVIFGKDPRMLRELARLAGTIEYELLCAVSSRVVRIYEE